jgi:hypothetical protein
MGREELMAQWLAAVPSLKESARMLEEPEVESFLGRVEETRSRGRVSQICDVADFDRQDVQQLLRGWGLQSAERCIALWPWDRAGLELPSETFVQYYDELWYPSRDDVWISDGESDTLIELNHEELVRLWRN